MPKQQVHTVSIINNKGIHSNSSNNNQQQHHHSNNNRRQHHQLDRHR